jgi:hypothetical protein
MKQIHNILSLLLVLLVAFGFSSCEKDIEAEEFADVSVDFTYQSSSIHYVIGEEISFINKSIIGSSWEWQFGDGATSSEKNPVHKYSVPATYKVKLIVDGGKHELEKSLMVSDIVPVVSFTSDDPTIIYGQSEVDFDVQLLNPENLEVSYKWAFPDATQGEGVDDKFMSTDRSPVVTFGKIGSQKVSLTVTMGDKQLAPVTVNVRVNYDKPMKTLYYAVKEGNVMARKIISDDIDESINLPYDLGFRSGKHPLTLAFAEDWCYVFDAGTKTSWAPDVTTAGDGEIFAVAHDGSKRETIIENFGGHSYYDFYYGFVDEKEGLIYWADRREGIFKTSIDTRNMKFDINSMDYFVRNSWLWYYGNGIGWGNINGPFSIVDGTYWFTKNTNGAGIFRFNDVDIKGEDKPAAGTLLDKYKIRGMAIDEVNGHIYVAEQSYKMIVCFDLNTGDFIKVVDGPLQDDGEGGASETLFVTGMDIDVDQDGNGYLYYAFRGVDGVEDPAQKSGIKRCKLNDDTATPEFFVEGVKVYGIAIDHQLR